MRTMQRVARSVAISVSILAALAISSVGAAGGFGQGPGTYSFSDTQAFDSFFNPVDGSNVNISVDRGRFMIRPRAGGPIQMSPLMTTLFISISGPQTDPTQPPVLIASGCFILPDSDFVVGSNLQTASVNATLGQGDVCPGFLVPVVGATPVKAAGGGGGGGTIGLSFPLTVSATWTGTGATSTQADQGRFSCGTFSSLTHSTFLSAFSSAITASISGFGDFSGGQLHDFGSVNQQNMRMEVVGSGILSAACGGQG